METRRRAVSGDVAVVRALLVATIVAVSVLAACGDDAVVRDPPVAAEVSIYPESVTLTTLGETRRFFAAVSDQYGEAFAGTITWSSSATGVFTVDANGTVTAVANGSGTLTASYESLSASASVTVDANRPPLPRGELPPFVLSVGGGALGLQPAAFFQDPDNDAADLTFTTHLSDPAVATAEVVVDSEGHAALLVNGTAVGTTELTVVATDPKGLSAEQSAAITVDGEGYTPFPGLVVADNTLEITGLALAGSCSPPLKGFVTVAGFVITINGSGWQSRTDTSTEWENVTGTLQTDGRLCPYTTTTAGEYRLVLNVTSQVDPHHEPITGDYRSQNTFTVVDTVSGNRAPKLAPDAFQALSLAAGGGPIPLLTSRYFSDPDGDHLTYAVANTDTSSLAAEPVVDSLGHTVAILSGKAEGMSTVTVTATDPGGLTAEWVIAVTVDDSGATPWPAVYVANGVLIAFGTELATCMPVVMDFQSVDGNIYTVHASKWQTRADSTAAWSDVADTQREDGRVCPHTATEAGDYRVVYEMSIVVDPHLPPTRGWYRSPNHFTVSSSGDGR